jgi:phosphoribosylglycinamide formyltransferase-1
MNNGIVVLISGRGSNLQAICEAGLTQHISCVISNNQEALGLEFARQQGLATHIINNKNFASREAFDHALRICIDQYAPRLVVLAGFMRILTASFVNHYADKIINIHPSLLPAFIGAKAQSCALNAKVKVSGVTVHFVTDKLDHGPIIAQGIVPVLPDDSEEDLSARILRLEHVIYPFVIQKLIADQVVIKQDLTVKVAKAKSDTEILGEYAQFIFY